MIGILHILEQLESFGSLPTGWNFGAGEASSPLAFRQAVAVLNQASGLGFEDLEAFPGTDGEIQINFYKDNDSLEAIFEIDGTISITLDTGEKSVCLGRDISLKKAVKFLQEFAFDKCHSSVFLTSQTTTALNTNDLLAWRSDPPATGLVFRSSRRNVASNTVAASVYTQQRTMPAQRERLSSFGKSRMNVSRKGARLVLA